MSKYFEEKTIAKLNFISLLLIIALLSLGMGYLFISGYNDVFKDELKKVEEDYIFLRKEKIRNLVNLRVSEMETKNGQVLDLLKKRLNKQVFAAHNISSIIYHTYKHSKGEPEIRALIKNAINSIRHAKGEGLYLICAEQRKMIICPSPNIFDKIVLDEFPVTSEKTTLRKIVRRTKTMGEAYYTFQDNSNSGQGGGVFFLKRFDIYNWFIGSLGRNVLIESKIKKRVLAALRNESKQTKGTNTMEVYELLEGDKGKKSLKVLFHSDKPQLEKQELTVFFQDAKGSRYIDKVINQIELNGSSFIQYWDIDDDKVSPRLKLTYYKLYPKWNWIVAMGFHIENSDMLQIQRMMMDLEKNMQDKIKSAAGLFLFFILVSVLISILFSRGIARVFNKYKQEVEDRSVELAKTNTRLNSEIMERKKVESSLRKSEEQMRRLASEVQLSEEKERRRIAGDLHDSIGASLAISNLKLELLSGKLITPEYLTDLKVVHENIKQVIQQTRSLTFQLSPPALYQVGLEAALAGLAEQTQQLHKIMTEFSDDYQEKYLEEDVRIHIFRSARELLVNVIKHADARHVLISVARVNQQIEIVVSDDGVGFEANDQTICPEEGGKFGLFSIRERLRLLGGHLEIKSNNGRGSTAIMRAPLKSAETVQERES